MTSLAPFAIGEVSIRQHDGLFSLNDLHKASGSVESQRPNQFLRIDQTKALIQELETAQICAVKTKEGRNGGTYACREIVIAYAAWISAAFHLKVIRVFLDVATPAQPYNAAPPRLSDRRWLISFDHHGKEQHLALDWNDCVIKYADLPKLIESGAIFDADLIARIGQACLVKLLATQQASAAAAKQLRQQAQRQTHALPCG